MKRSLALGLLLSACAGVGVYTPSTIILPAGIQKITVRPFVNQTQFFGLENRLRFQVEQEFIRDGRRPYVNTEVQADGILEGEIVNYIKEPVSYDANHVEEEFKLWVVMNIRLIDRANNKILWEEPRLEQDYSYFIETKPGGIAETEARDRLWDLFARDIVKRTIDGFGSVSGASEKKISTQPLPQPQDTTSPSPQEPLPRVPPPSPY
jgi:hypothetical protein